MNRNRATRLLILVALMLSLSAASFAGVFIGVGISVHIGPPALPAYAQPVCPGPGYIWTPGYWAWNDVGGYYWVPGTWVLAPVGMLWTPGYWGWGGGVYVWHPGYWGPHVGFYGGINYGFGYAGVGFVGGEWRGGAFFYNRSVTNINIVNVHNVYEHTVVVNNSHFAFNGPGGVNVRPTPEEERYANERHTPALASQMQHERVASQNRALFASENHGRPSIAATGRPGDFNGRNVVAAHAAGAAYHEPRMSPQEARVNSENRAPENRNQNRSFESRNENNRDMARSENRDNARQARQEQKQQAHEQQAERKQAQRAQKQQREEQKHETRGPGR
jgi:WXXGXW repeat (2 copies)